MLFKSVLSVALLVASAAADIAFTSWPSSIEAGSTYALTWAGGDSSPVTILLRQGPSTALVTVGTITTTGSDGSYSWTAPSTYPPAADYAFEIVQGSDVNYSGLNSYTGGTAAVSSAAAPPSYSASSAGWASASSVPQSAAPTWAPSSHYNGTNATSTSWTMKPTPSTVMTTSALPPATKPSTAPANMGSTLQSPLALIFGAIAAMIYLQ